MLLELHTHSSLHSECSTIAPVDLVRQVLKKGLQGLVLTEHHYQWNEDDLHRLASEAGVPSFFRIFSGQELETDIGHVLVFGGLRTIPEFIHFEELRKLFPDAAIVWAHPYRNGATPSSELLGNPAIDAIEILSLNHTPRENYRGITDWHARRFTATSGSDTHSLERAGIFPTQFDHPVENISDVAREIKNGRCHPFFKEIPKAGGAMVVTEVTIGTKGNDELRQRIIIKKVPSETRWNSAKQSSKLTETLIKQGFGEKTFRVPKIVDIDESAHCIIEEGQRGGHLFDVLLKVKTSSGRHYIELAANWLARLHNLKLKVTDVSDLKEREERRLSNYEESFVSSGNPDHETAGRVIEHIRKREATIFEDAQHFVQCHGDYHPKNIIIGQDLMHDPTTVFLSVIDFDNTLYFSPAFDVGYFIAQFESQFHEYPAIVRNYREKLFIDAYLSHAKLGLDKKRFLSQVDVFKMRAFMSIGAFFIKVGKGQSPEMSFIIERSRSLLGKKSQA